MPYEYLEDVSIADTAFRAWAPDLEGTFMAAADATANVMVEDLGAVRPEARRQLRLEGPTHEMLLFDLLNELVFLKDAEQLILRLSEVRIAGSPAGFRLDATAVGEKLDPSRHATQVDVKAVTLYRFELRQTAAGWEATVVLDV